MTPLILGPTEKRVNGLMRRCSSGIKPIPAEEFVRKILGAHAQS